MAQRDLRDDNVCLDLKKGAQRWMVNLLGVVRSQEMVGYWLLAKNKNGLLDVVRSSEMAH